MNITEAILRRRSVRIYTGEPLEPAIVEKIRSYISGLKAPFGAKCRIEIVHTGQRHDFFGHPAPAQGFEIHAGAYDSRSVNRKADTGVESVKLGTYGFVKGASDFLALIVEKDSPMSEEGAAYMFEQVVLYCTSLGLGTCWLGGSFNRSDFRKRSALKPDETLRIVSPVGYASDKRHLSLLSVFGSSKPKPRKPFAVNFFRDRFDNPLTEAEAGPYALPLEMVRMAPSANNKQSWRVVMDDLALHFYKSSSFGFDAIDLGIALCHFEQTCLESGIPGGFMILDIAPEGKKADYVVSWIRQQG